MEEKTNDLRYILNSDSTLYRLDSQILSNCKEFDCDYRIGAQLMDFIKQWFRSKDNKTGCRFVLVDAMNEEHTLRYYERNGFKPLFLRIADEKKFYGIEPEEDLKTRMYYFDLLY